MSVVSRLPGIRPRVLSLLAWRSIGSHRVRSLVTVLVVMIAVIAVIASTGRTEATRRSLLARLEDPSARLVRIVDRDGQANLSPADIDHIARLESVAWVIGLSPAGPIGRNPNLGDPRRGYASEAVGTRRYWGELTGGPLVRLAAGRQPHIGEAVAGARAAGALGMADRVGTVDDEERGPLAVVGAVTAEGPVENLAAYVLIRAPSDEAGITEIAVLVRTSAQVESVVRRLPDLLTGGTTPVAIERATQLLQIRESLATEVGELDAAILAGSLTSSAFLVAAILYGAIEERRREFGLRRSLGATRSTIAALVIIESALLAVVGTLLGGIGGSAIVASQTGQLPDPALTLAVCALVSLVAVGGSIPPAIVAAVREPLYVLRSE